MARGDWPEETGLEPGALRARRWRWAGLAAALLAVAGIVTVIHVSTLRVRYGTRVYGGEDWRPGGRAALRITVFDLAARAHHPRFRAVARLETPDGTVLPLGEGVGGAVAAVDVTAGLPDELPPGDAVLEVRVETDLGAPETARFPVTVRPPEPPAPPEAWLVRRHPCEEGSRRTSKGSWTRSPACREGRAVWLYPESGHLVGNLENRVWLAAPEGGRVAAVRTVPERPPGTPPPARGDAAPDAAPDAAEDLPADAERLALDLLGLAGWRLVPGWPRGDVEVRVDGTVERSFLRDRPTQVLVSSARPLVTDGRPLSAEVRLVRGEVPVYLELLRAGRLVDLRSHPARGGALEVAFEVPGDAGFVALRAYTGLEAPESAWDERVFWVSGADTPGRALRELAEAVAGLPPAAPLHPDHRSPGPDPLLARILALDAAALARIDGGTAARAAGALLSRVETVRTPTAPLLGDTTPTKVQALEAFQRRVRRPILAGLAGLAAAVLALAGAMVLLAQRRMRRRLAELEVDDWVLADEAGARPERITRPRIGAVLLGFLLVLAAALTALLTLLETLRWDRGG